MSSEFLESYSKSSRLVDSMTSVSNHKMLQRCLTIGEERSARLYNEVVKTKNRISIRTDGKIVILKISDVQFIKAAGNYIEIHSRVQKYLIRDTLSNMQNRLPDSLFVRIHRSVIVNTDYIAEIMTWYNGELKVVLTNGEGLVVSRNYRSNIEALLELM
jgi:two-component system LytT family response regulator